MWSEKHKPRTLEEMVGNEEGRTKTLAWLKKWKPGAKAALLVGPPGTGKTTTVHLIASKLGLQLVELNASDVRTKDKLSRKMGEALESTNLFGTGTLVFLDEVDGLAGRSDYGAIDYIKDAVRTSRSPVVMAANDPESDEVKKLSRFTSKIEFHRPEVEVVEERLWNIAGEEGMQVSQEEISKIAKAAHGDLRVALNFLQSGLPMPKDEEATAAQAIDGFFFASDRKEALRALRSYPGQPRDKIRDLFTAVVKSRVHEERKASALDALSKADIVMGRMLRGKDWRLLRYLDALLASELWAALGDGGPKYTADAVPWPLLVRIWNDSKKMKDIASAAGRRLGTSQRGFLVQDAPYVFTLCEGKSFRDAFVESLGLEENYAEFISKEAQRTARLQL